MEELYESLYGLNNVTLISNEFLNKYLADTKPEYIKVFLFYLWKGIKEGYTIQETSSEIDLKEEEIEMALKFWIKKKLIKKECLVGKSKDKSIDGEVTDKDVKQNNIIDLNSRKKELINKNRKEYASVEKDLLFVAEKLLGKTLSERQVKLIAQCYNEYNFDESIIQYLLEYCSNVNQTDARYMGAVAASWYEKNIKTVDEAKKFTESFSKSKTNVKSNKANNKRALDRKDDNYWDLFTDSVANGKFK